MEYKQGFLFHKQVKSGTERSRNGSVLHNEGGPIENVGIPLLIFFHPLLISLIFLFNYHCQDCASAEV